MFRRLAVIIGRTLIRSSYPAVEKISKEYPEVNASWSWTTTRIMVGCMNVIDGALLDHEEALKRLVSSFISYLTVFICVLFICGKNHRFKSGSIFRTKFFRKFSSKFCPRSTKGYVSFLPNSRPGPWYICSVISMVPFMSFW